MWKERTLWWRWWRQRRKRRQGGVITATSPSVDNHSQSGRAAATARPLSPVSQHMLRPIIRYSALAIVVTIMVLWKYLDTNLLMDKNLLMDTYSESDMGGASFKFGGGDIQSANTRRLERPGYLVWTPSCQIPNVDAYDDSIRQLLQPVDPIVCSRLQPLTYVAPVDESTQGSYVLRVDEALVPSYIPKGQRVSCCYSNITRVNPPPGRKFDQNVDNRFSISHCKHFEKEVKLKPEEEFIFVRCQSIRTGKKKSPKDVYTNMHGVVPIKKIVKEKRRERKTPEDDDWLNVLIIAYDSISQLNLVRTMPRTVAYLKRAGFVNLNGYNKIGDNTFPNVMAIMTGLNSSLMKPCWPSPKSKIDDCPFLWKEYNKQGYVTAYLEDEPTMSTFNYHKTGFANPPTDYYFRPYMLAAAKHLRVKTTHNLGVCLGPVSTTDHVMKYLLNFVTTFKNSLYFSLVWLNNFSHNDLNDPGSMDLRTLQFFNELSGTDIYNNTLVIFLSDHGMRFGKIRETFQGWFEERLPYIYFLLPEWYRKKYPNFYENLLTNRNRLTSPYDLHVTLKDLLHIPQNITLVSHNVSLACPKCKSLFSEDFGDRSCDDAGISPHWCTCTQYKELPTNNSVVQGAVKYVISEIQKKLKENSEAHQCAEIHVKQIVRSKMKIHADTKKKIDHNDYLIMFETVPGGGLFESTVRHETNTTTNNKFSIFGTVSRINSYGSQGDCVNDGELKLYCFCLFH